MDNKEQQIRCRVERLYKRHFRRSMPEATWDKLKRDDWIRNIKSGDYSCEEVFEEVKQWAEAMGLTSGLERRKQRMLEPTSSKERASTDISLRFEALSRLAAGEASHSAARLAAGEAYYSVKDLRQRHLGGKLLPLAEIEAWLISVAEHEKQAKTEPVDIVRDLQGRHGQSEFWRRQGFELLQFLAPIVIPDLADLGLGPHPTLTTPRALRLNRYKGALEEIRSASAVLAYEFLWDEAASTTFLLTGRVPEIRPVDASYVPAMLSGLSRVTLSVHPTLTPQEVAKEWTHIRKQVLGKRHRNQSDKLLTLAIFDSEQPPGATLKEKMAAWNKRYGKKPKWGYTEETNFGRDVQRTRRRLLGPEV